MKNLAIVLVGVSISLLGTSALAKPNFKAEIKRNTVCAFINANDVRIRESPSADAPVVATLKRGDGVRAYPKKGEWVQIAARTHGFDVHETYSHFQGYVSNKYINGCAENEFDRWRK